MAVAKLTGDIWWSNMNGPVEARGQYRSVLDLSGPYTADNQHYRLSQIDPKALIFRLPITEDEKPSISFVKTLIDFHSIVDRDDCYPLLVHCMAGQCRSPAVALFLAWEKWPYLQNLENLITRMRSLAHLNGGVDENRLFHKSLQEYMRTMSQLGGQQ